MKTAMTAARNRAILKTRTGVEAILDPGEIHSAAWRIDLADRLLTAIRAGRVPRVGRPRPTSRGPSAPAPAPADPRPGDHNT